MHTDGVLDIKYEEHIRASFLTLFGKGIQGCMCHMMLQESF